MTEDLDPASAIHVIPENDLRPHEVSIKCWCKPHWNDGIVGGIAVHNAMDQRELRETGERKPS